MSDRSTNRHKSQHLYKSAFEKLKKNKEKEKWMIKRKCLQCPYLEFKKCNL